MKTLAAAKTNRIHSLRGSTSTAVWRRGAWKRRGKPSVYLQPDWGKPWNISGQGSVIHCPSDAEVSSSKRPSPRLNRMQLTRLHLKRKVLIQSTLYYCRAQSIGVSLAAVRSQKTCERMNQWCWVNLLLVGPSPEASWSVAVADRLVAIVTEAILVNERIMILKSLS